MEILFGFIYIGAVLAVFLTIISVFIFILRREKDWNRWLWYKIVLACLAADILSTVYFVYILGFGWEKETNILVRTYGSSIGNLNALLVGHLLLAVFIGLASIFFRKRVTSLYIFVCAVFIMILTQVILSNLVLMTLKFFQENSALGAIF